MAPPALTEKEVPRPPQIFAELKRHVVGQDESLKYVAVALYKHLLGERHGHLLLLGNSGTGKTTIMKAVERFYAAHPLLASFRAEVRMNAGVLGAEEGEFAVVPCRPIFRQVEDRVRQLVPSEALDAATLKAYMERATVCLDEVDKISGKVGGKPYVTGIGIQQSLLTLMEGEEVLWEACVTENGEPVKRTISLDTSRMLFLCGGAFEELYDQVRYRVVVKDRVNVIRATMVDGQMEYRDIFSLKEFMRQDDLFDYGMLPQFLSRFDHAVVMRDLDFEDLRKIFMGTEDSVFQASKRFFARLNVALEVDDAAVRRICREASKQTRIGARALKEVYGRVIKEFEYDPFNAPEVHNNGDRYELCIDEALVAKALREPGA